MNTTRRIESETAYSTERPFGNEAALDALFRPKSVAIIGANEQPNSVGHATLSALTQGEFGGSTFVVHPERSSLLGHATYPSLSAISAKVDLAIVVAAAESAPDLVAECVANKVKGVILLSSGFGPKGEEASAGERMRAVLAGSRTRVIGPKALGVMNPQFGLNATPGLPMLIGGTVAFVSESATLGRLVLDWSLKNIVGFSAFASIGNMLDVSWANLIDYFGRDPNTRTIMLQISSIGDARSFISAAREVALDKPILVIKAGRGGASVGAVGWRSRCVASDSDVLTAAFHRVGVLEVDTLEDLFYTAEALSKQPRPAGPRLMIVSNADGAAVLAADSVMEAGVEVAQPSPETRRQLEQLLPAEHQIDDVMGDGSAENFMQAVEVAAGDPNCDGLLLLMISWTLADPQGMAHRLLELQKQDKPILISYMGSAEMAAAQENLIRACIPTFTSPAAAARVFRYMWRYGYDLQGLYETPTLHAELGNTESLASVNALIDAARADGRTSLSVLEANKILAAYGIADGGWRSGDMPGGGPWAKLGSRIDEQFGPVLMFGSADGGPGVYGAMVVGLPPLNATLARLMLQQSEFYRALLREHKLPSMPALETVLMRFSQLVAEQPWIKEFEIDRLLITRGQVLAVRSRCELHSPQTKQNELPMVAIRPYPVQYVSSWTMKNGQTVTIRPILAEDEPSMVKFHEGLSDHSVYLRYFQRVKLSTRTSHQRLSRVCFLDYDRELALLAEHCDSATGERRIIAVATLVKIPHKSEGELAVLVSDDYHRQGLGKELIGRMVHVAREEGLAKLTASTMIENAGMTTVFKKLGFQVFLNPEEELVEVVLALR